MNNKDDVLCFSTQVCGLEKGIFYCAGGEIRTLIPVKEHASEACVSTNFTTSAYKV